MEPLFGRPLVVPRDAILAHFPTESDAIDIPTAKCFCSIRAPRRLSLARLARKFRVCTYSIARVELLAAVNGRIMQSETQRRALLLTLCALVFMFALRAKIDVYNGVAPAKATPSTASKLWVSGQKMEVQSVDPGTGMLFWMAVLCLIGVCLHRELRVRSAFRTPPPRNLPLRQMHRFLRPPPFCT